MKSQKTQKVVQVIARYFIKRNHAVVYSVRSSNGADTYCTTIINGKATGCTCPATKPCYHMVQLEAKEAARKELVAAEHELVAERKMAAYLNAYDDMAAEKTASIEAVRQAAYAEAQTSGIAGSYKASWYR